MTWEPSIRPAAILKLVLAAALLSLSLLNLSQATRMIGFLSDHPSSFDVHLDGGIYDDLVKDVERRRRRRDFVTDPITNRESRLLTERLRARYVGRNVTVPRIALCHPDAVLHRRTRTDLSRHARSRSWP